MANSSLINCTNLSPNHSGKRTHIIDRITPHCFVGQVTVQRGLEVFLPKKKEASCNYVIGYDGKLGLCVDESNRSWCTSSRENDQRAITIECASNTVAPYEFNNAVYLKLIDLCVDICKRYNRDTLVWIYDKTKALSYVPKNNEMQITVHRWFANKSCPGDWLFNRLNDLTKIVNERLKPVTKKIIYRVQVGAYKIKDNANKTLTKLKGLGYEAFITKGDDNLYRVQIGAYSVKSNAENMSKKLIKDGFSTIIKKVEM